MWTGAALGSSTSLSTSRGSLPHFLLNPLSIPCLARLLGWALAETAWVLASTNLWLIGTGDPSGAYSLRS